MAGFLYFLPGEHAGDLASVTNAGLGYAFDRAPTSVQLRGPGPSGAPGCVLAYPGSVDPASVGYHADRQTWRKIPKLDAWVGYTTDARPTPDDLARLEMLSGCSLRLADGNEWLVPIARGWSDDLGGTKPDGST